MNRGENVHPQAAQVPVRVTLLGSGDAFGSGGRFQACVSLSAGPARHLIDRGASSLIAMRRSDLAPNWARAILLTHLHGDHFGGVPFFIPDAQLNSRRTAPIVVAGPLGPKRRIEEAMEVLFPGSSGGRRRLEVEPPSRHSPPATPAAAPSRSGPRWRGGRSAARATPSGAGPCPLQRPAPTP